MRASFLCKPQWRLFCVLAMVFLGQGLFCGSATLGESLILPERVGTQLPQDNKWKATPTLPQACHHWAEVQVTLDKTWILDRFDTLPCAPGSRLEVLDGDQQIKAQWPATVVADLIEQGADLVVLRDFMLVQNSDKDAAVVDKGLTGLTSSTADGDFVSGRNDTDVPIPYFEYAYSYIEIDEAESHALVTTIDVHYEIIHPFSGDLVVDISDERLVGPYLRLMEGGSSDDINETVRGITEFAGHPVNQYWYLWAIDLYMGYSGYIDSWWIKVYYTFPTETAEHDFCENAVVLQDGVPYEGRTVGATGNYVTWAGYKDMLDVWHVFTPTQSGPVTVYVESDDKLDDKDYLDTTLAVFDGCGGQELGSIDDLCNTVGGRITVQMEGDADYYIRVAGYGYDTGNYTLTVTQQPAVLPDEPTEPSPSDGAEAVETSAVLSWNDWLFQEARATQSRKDKDNGRTPKLIFGRDDRQEEYEVTDADTLRAGDATVALVYWSDLHENEDGTYTLPWMTFDLYYQLVNPIGTYNSLCRDEPYLNQPTAAFCSGVLVTPDIVATAGHCVACTEPNQVAVVFGYVMEDDLTPVVTFQPDQVYRCSDVIVCQEGDPDWSLIRLGRPVQNHVPMLARMAERAEEGQSLLITGHPYGMPRKYDGAAVLKRNPTEAFFEANFDAAPGNSGSPVFNLDTLEIEGLLVSGPATGFEEDTVLGCDRTRVCPDDTGCPEFAWERITRITALSKMIPSYDLYLGTDPDNLQLVSGYGVTPWVDPGPLEAETTYYWRVTARNAWGQTEGPLWSFSTAAAPDCSMVYRFWSNAYSYHFYTIRESERDNLINNHSDAWTYDGEAFCAYPEASLSGLAPIYRFWSPKNHRHFYTISESEKEGIISNYPPETWTYEAVAFYAYPEGAQPADASPVYRFWSNQVGAHYYTIDEAEKEQMIAEEADAWTFEGIAWYAYE